MLYIHLKTNNKKIKIKCGPPHPLGKSHCGHKDRGLILTSGIPFFKSVETQNAGNEEGRNKRSDASFLPPALPASIKL